MAQERQVQDTQISLKAHLSKYNVSDTVYILLYDESITIDELITFTIKDLEDWCIEHSLKTIERRSNVKRMIQEIDKITTKINVDSVVKEINKVCNEIQWFVKRLRTTLLKQVCGFDCRFNLCLFWETYV